MEGKRYNLVVKCHIDMVEVISSSLIIPKPNVSFSFKGWTTHPLKWYMGWIKNIKVINILIYHG